LGTNLGSATKAVFGNIEAVINYSSPAQISVKLPVNTPARCKITVTTPAGTVSSPSDFEVAAEPVQPPKIKDFNPKAGAAGTNVTIIGAKFTGASRVLFGNIASNCIVNSDNQLTTSVPAGAKTGKITVVTQGGTDVGPIDFKVIISAPKISAFEPNKGTPGTKLAIKGDNLSGTNLKVVLAAKGTVFERERADTGRGAERMPAAAMGRERGASAAGGLTRRTMEETEIPGMFREKEEIEFPLQIISVADNFIVAIIPKIKFEVGEEMRFAETSGVEMHIRVRTDSGEDTSAESFNLILR
jgi:hypothetical protein